ncbi:MAG: phosphotransferase, partial [Armatimonadota bacterium]
RVTSLEREAANLRAVQATRPGGFDSIPRIVAFEEYAGRPILVETALVGQPMNRQTVQRDPETCCTTVINWLMEVQQATCSSTRDDPHWFERLVEKPLSHFASVFPSSADETQLLERTRKLVAPLRRVSLPLVFEHGDLSHPNLLLLKGGGAGVVDWELAEPRGLPVCDLFFFLTYAAFALGSARSTDGYLPAFHAAFFGPSAWARRYVLAYAERLSVPSHLLTPLFAACWARYVAGLLIRRGDDRHSRGPLTLDTAAWLRANRYYALWRHTVARVDELDWDNCPKTFRRGFGHRFGSPTRHRAVEMAPRRP